MNAINQEQKQYDKKLKMGIRSLMRDQLKEDSLVVYQLPLQGSPQ